MLHEVESGIVNVAGESIADEGTMLEAVSAEGMMFLARGEFWSVYDSRDGSVLGRFETSTSDDTARVLDGVVFQRVANGRSLLLLLPGPR